MQDQSHTRSCSDTPVGYRVTRTCVCLCLWEVLVGNPGKNPSLTLLS